MHIRFKMTVAALFLITSASSSASIPVKQKWAIGEGREVDEGIYFTLLKVENGWRLWRIETQGSIECRAVKSARGNVHPFPIGAGAMFGFGEPYITVWKLREKLLYSWKGVDFDNSVIQIRRVGDKFWSTDKGNEIYTEADAVEVNVLSWEYPAVRVGYHEAKGVLDFRGLSAILTT